MKETQLQYACVDYLMRCAAPDVIYCHVDNGGKQTAGQKIHKYRMGVLAGFPDFLVLQHGKPHFIEFKVGRRGLTEKQESVRARIRAQGLPFVIVRSLDQFIELMSSWGVVR